MGYGVIIFLLLLGFILSLLASWLFYRHDKDIGRVISAVQALVTVIALFLAGFWYFVERKGFPHAGVKISAQTLKLAGDAVLMLVRVDVTNNGNGLLRVDQADIRMMAVRMNAGHLGELLALPSAAFPAHFRDGRDLYEYGEIQWKGLRELGYRREHDIEPGETDTLFADLIAPCTERALKLSASVRRPGKQDLWWKDRLLVDLATLCGGEVGARAALGPDVNAIKAGGR